MKSLPESSILVEHTVTKCLSPIEVKMYDFHHRETQNPWDLLPDAQGEKLIKVVPTRNYQFVRAGHHLVLQVKEGIRVHLFRHILGKSPDDRIIDNRHYYDHVHHIGQVIFQQLGLPKKQWNSVRNNLKKEQFSSRLSNDVCKALADIRQVLFAVVLCGTTQIQVLADEEAYGFGNSNREHQSGLFDDDVPAEILAEMMADEEEESYPLFKKRYRLGTPHWTRGTVSDFNPTDLPLDIKTIQLRITERVNQYLLERL